MAELTSSPAAFSSFPGKPHCFAHQRFLELPMAERFLSLWRALYGKGQVHASHSFAQPASHTLLHSPFCSLVYLFIYLPQFFTRSFNRLFTGPFTCLLIHSFHKQMGRLVTKQTASARNDVSGHRQPGGGHGLRASGLGGDAPRRWHPSWPLRVSRSSPCERGGRTVP